MKGLVSIIIPAFNAGKWIQDTIHSALGQTWKSREIIIVDDGSADNTYRIAKSFESSSVKVIRQENQGASAARNAGIRFAQGDYLQWLDADDLLKPDKIELQMRRIGEPGDDRVLHSSAWGTFYTREERTKFTPNSLWQDLTPVEWISIKMNENRWMAIENWLVSRRLTEMAGPWDERISLDDDGEYFSRILANSRKVKFTPDAMSCIRRGDVSSISSAANISDQKLESLFLSIRLQIERLLSMENSEKTRRACIHFLQNYLPEFYPDKTELIQKANDLAESLGGNLSVPEIKLRYRIIRNLFGWNAANRARLVLMKSKNALLKNLDKVC